MSSPARIVVLISGRGSNLKSLIEKETDAFEVVGVVSNRRTAEGLKIARLTGIPNRYLSQKDFEDRAAFDGALAQVVQNFQPDWVVLAGFMRILSPIFVNQFLGRLVNIHPSLLPRYPGLHTHQRALEAGDREHGASLHFVTSQLDGGPVIMQARITIGPKDTPERLAARLLPLEHQLIVTVVELLAKGSVEMIGHAAHFNGSELTDPLRLSGWVVKGERICEQAG